MVVFVFKILFIISCISFIYSQESKTIELKPLNIFNLTEIVYDNVDEIVDKDLLEDKKFIEHTKWKTKLASCLLIMRSSLMKGNKEVSQALNDTKHDKAKTYDKIQAMMLERCVENITESIVDKVLHADRFALWEDSYSTLLTFNKNIFQIIGPELKYSSTERRILDEINLITNQKPVEEKLESLDLLSIFLGVYKYFLYGFLTGVLVFVGFLVFHKLIFKHN